jgi:probable HAF family extracellular repeat protein
LVQLPAVPSSIGNTPQVTAGLALNDADTVVGWSVEDNATTGQRTTATVWRNGKVTDLGILPQDDDVEAVGINNSGQIAGSGIGTGRAWLYQNGTTTFLPPLPGGTTAEAFGISGDGQVLGVANTNASTVDAHAVVWRGGRPVDLGVLPTGSYAEARAMNGAGVAVGDASVHGDAFGGERHPVIYANGRVIDLWPDLQTTWAFAKGINSAGVVVGDGPVGWVYQNGTRTDLNTLIPAGTGYKIVAGEAINDAGQIVALAVPNGSPRQTVAVLLTPVAG